MSRLKVQFGWFIPLFFFFLPLKTQWHADNLQIDNMNKNRKRGNNCIRIRNKTDFLIPFCLFIVGLTWIIFLLRQIERTCRLVCLRVEGFFINTGKNVKILLMFNSWGKHRGISKFYYLMGRLLSTRTSWDGLTTKTFFCPLWLKNEIRHYFYCLKIRG